MIHFEVHAEFFSNFIVNYRGLSNKKKLARDKFSLELFFVIGQLGSYAIFIRWVHPLWGVPYNIINSKFLFRLFYRRFDSVWHLKHSVSIFV